MQSRSTFSQMSPYSLHQGVLTCFCSGRWTTFEKLELARTMLKQFKVKNNKHDDEADSSITFGPLYHQAQARLCTLLTKTNIRSNVSSFDKVRRLPLHNISSTNATSITEALRRLAILSPLCKTSVTITRWPHTFDRGKRRLHRLYAVYDSELPLGTTGQDVFSTCKENTVTVR